MSHRMIALPLLLALAACSSPSDDGFVARADAPQAVQTSAAASQAALMMAALPAPIGDVRAVQETSYPNGLRQTATLDGAVSGLGRNSLEIAVATLATSGPGGVAVRPPSEAAIRREITQRYPGLDMRILTQPRRNALGVFGLAVGKAKSGARCAFAWQWVEDFGQTDDRSFFARGGAPTPASIRIHLCRSDATVDDLAAAIEGLTRAAPATLAAALDPARRPALAPARDSARVAAATDGSLETALTASAPRTTVAAAPRRGEKRRQMAQRAAPRAQAEHTIQMMAPAAGVAPAGPRYLAPLPGQVSVGSIARPVAAASGGSYPGVSYPVAGASAPGLVGSRYSNAGYSALRRPLDPSLPAAAYRGPIARTY